MYADDQAIFAKTPETLQSMLTDVENYCNLWGLKINISKKKSDDLRKWEAHHV
jgi:hypothetical protein